MADGASRLRLRLRRPERVARREAATDWKWRSTSLQGCPKEVRLLLAGGLYYDVDMVNSLPNVARQLDELGWVPPSCLEALKELCSDRTTWLQGIVEYHGLTGTPELGVTPRDVAKELPIRLLHGGSYAAWLKKHSLAERTWGRIERLEKQLRICRQKVYETALRHPDFGGAWVAEVTERVRKEKAGKRGGGGGSRDTWLHDSVVTGVFARVIQSLEDRCLDCARRSLERDGWPTRSWQQDGLLVEDGSARRLTRSGRRLSGGGEALPIDRLKAAARQAEAAIRSEEKMEIAFLVKDFFEEPIDGVLRRFAGDGGGEGASVEEAREAMREARTAAQRGAPRQLRRPAAVVVAERRTVLESAVLREDVALCRLVDAEETLQALETALQDGWAAYADRIDGAEAAAAEAAQAEVVRAAQEAEEAAWAAAALEAEALRTAGMAAVAETEALEEAAPAAPAVLVEAAVAVELEAGGEEAEEEEMAAAGVGIPLEAPQREARWSLGGDWRRREATCRKRKRGEEGDDGIDGDDGSSGSSSGGSSGGSSGAASLEATSQGEVAAAAAAGSEKKKRNRGERPHWRRRQNAAKAARTAGQERLGGALR